MPDAGSKKHQRRRKANAVTERVSGRENSGWSKQEVHPRVSCWLKIVNSMLKREQDLNTNFVSKALRPHAGIVIDAHYVYNDAIILPFMRPVNANWLLVKIFKVITTWDSNAVSSACQT
ncbi:protein of unknown function [Serratia sp. Tan611]|nr:protein of unknown function [Serratia sp. Tan611]